MDFQVSQWAQLASNLDVPSTGPATTSGLHVNFRDRPRVLVAEDDDDLRWLICDELRREGLDVIGCASALEVCHRNEWIRALAYDPSALDVIVADLCLGDIDGLALLQRVAEAEVDLPVIMISAFADVDVRARAGELGAAAFLDKPIEMKKLRQLVHQLSEDHRRRMHGVSRVSYSRSRHRSKD